MTQEFAALMRPVQFIAKRINSINTLIQDLETPVTELWTDLNKHLSLLEERVTECNKGLVLLGGACNQISDKLDALLQKVADRGGA